MKAGFIGLGSLGAPIARKIARSGFPLTVFDISPAAMQAFDEPGAELAGDPLEVASAADVLCVCVRMDGDLVDLAGDGALFAALGEGGVFVIHSTVAPELCQQLASVPVWKKLQVRRLVPSSSRASISVATAPSLAITLVGVGQGACIEKSWLYIARIASRPASSRPSGRIISASSTNSDTSVSTSRLRIPPK